MSSPMLLRTRRGSRQDGFTLVELLVSMTILVIVSTMIIGTWIALTDSSAFAQSEDTAASSAAYAIDRVSAELRDAQPPSTSSTTPFIFSTAISLPNTLTSPLVCDGYDCTFYSAYNNPLAASQSGANGVSELLPTAVWLDSSGNLWWVRDTNGDGSFDAGDKAILLARNVVNNASGINRPIFTYVFCSSGGVYSTSNSLTAANCSTLVAIDIEIVVDQNLKNAPTYVDYVSTVCPQH